MSSPAETVDRVLAWLGQVFRIVLPALPLAGVYRRFTALFDMSVTAKLPEPTDPLPWTIDVAGGWSTPIPGLDVSLDAIRIQVSADLPPGSPSDMPPSVPVPRPPALNPGEVP